MNIASNIPPVLKTVHLDCSPTEAFRAFTEDFSQWWPYATHSLGRADNVAHVVFEGGSGGRLYEVWKDGSKHLWGSITTWNPPGELAFSWHVGRDPALATEVRVTIRPDDGGSLMELSHSKWEILGDEAAGMRARYDAGWTEVFERCFGGFARRRTGSP